jgi:hypothetical protein
LTETDETTERGFFVNTILPSSTGRVRTWSTTIVALLSGVGAGLTAALAVFPVGKVAGALCRAEAMACALLMISAVLGVVLISTDSLDV